MSENNVRYYNIEGKPPKRKKKKTGLYIFGGIIILLLLLTLLMSCAGDSENGADYGKDHIAVLHIEGTIQEDTGSVVTGEYSHTWTMEQLETLIENDDNKGLILYVDTPGGSVYETDELYLKILEYKETGRPVYVYMGSMAASGGYYISAPADKIYANRNCWTGSIGVTLGTMYDVSDLLDKYGIKTVTITSGDNKAMGSSVEPMSKEQKEIFQSLVDEAYDQFVAIVAEGRGMSEAEVRKLADGRIYTAKQAKENGLIDEIGTYDDVVADMKHTYKLGDCEVNELAYENDSMFDSMFMKFTGVTGRSEQGDVSALLELMENQNKVPIVYMSEIRK